MTAQDFVLWLQGYADAGGPAPDEAQWSAIKAKLESAVRYESDRKSPLYVVRDENLNEHFGAISEAEENTTLARSIANNWNMVKPKCR